MSINDLFTSSCAEISSTMDDFDEAMNYDNPDLMSSEFFDSVLSLENNMGDGFLSNLEDDINLSSDASSHMDEVLSPESFYSESDKNSSCTETNDETGLLHNVDNFDDPIFKELLDSVPPLERECIRVAAPTERQPTKILIQNPNNKKFIAKPFIANQLKKASLKVKPQIIKVQSLINDGRPVLLPFDVKGIQILNAPINMATLSKNIKTTPKVEVLSEDETNYVSSTNQYPPLTLTQEEKKLLVKEGIQLPTHHPLTKNEERELKRIRRKIRNKISAQDSRKRKKEYVDGLEERVKRGCEENKNLLQRVKELQRQNKTLVAHVNKLQAMIRNSTSTKATPSTCLMVVLLSALLVSLPNMKLFENKQMSSEQEQMAIRRSLLSSPQATEDDALNMEEFLVFNDSEENKSKFAEDVADIENTTEKEFSKMLEEMENKFKTGFSEKDSNSKGDFFGRLVNTVKGLLSGKQTPQLSSRIIEENKLLEPDIDDYVSIDEGPPLKRMRIKDDLDPEKVVTTTLNKNKIAVETKDK